MRDFSVEHKDNSHRKYHYGFDDFNRLKLIEAFGPHFQKGPSLEIGAYRGAMTHLISEQLGNLTVVEAATDLAQDLADRFPAVSVVNSLVEDWVSDIEFDNIFLVHTLEHIDNRQSVLTKIRGLLSEKGRLFVAVPNARALSRLIAVEMGVVDYPEAITEGERLHGHTVTYNLDTLQDDILAAGLSVITSGGVVLKTLANFQIDRAIEAGIISPQYLEACNQLAKTYPEFSSSIFVVAAKTPTD